MIHREEITALLRALNEASGFRLSLHDASFGEIAAYPEGASDFCSCVHMKEALYRRCMQCDAVAFSAAKATGKLYIYRCYMGLCEAVSPIIQDGVLMGYLMMGQVLEDTPGARECLQEAIRKLDPDSAKTARALVGRIPAISRTALEAFSKIMTACAGYIAMSDLLRANGESPAEAARQYIENHYGEKVTIDTLCRRFHCCRATMTATYKKKYGETVSASLMRIRLNRAREMMAAGSSVTEASSACGFTDPSYFSKCYRRLYGCAPSTERETARRQKQVAGGKV